MDKSDFGLGLIIGALVVAVIAAFLIITHAPPTGRAGGACFSNKTCHEGLHCYAGDKFWGVCLDPKTIRIDGKEYYLQPRTLQDGGTP